MPYLQSRGKAGILSKDGFCTACRSPNSEVSNRQSVVRSVPAMTKELIPPPDLAPSIPEGATPQQCVAMWLDLMDACEQFLLAGLRREIGPDGDLRAAYQKWYAEQMEEHDRTMAHMMAEIKRRGGGRGRTRNESGGSG